MTDNTLGFSANCLASIFRSGAKVRQLGKNQTVIVAVLKKRSPVPSTKLFKRCSLLLLLLLDITGPALSDISQNYQQQVQAMYIAYYGRPGDPEGVYYWSNQVAASGGELTAIVNAFGASDEYTARFATVENHDLVNNIYQQLLNRDADTGGLTFYLAQLQSGAMTLASIAVDIANGVRAGTHDADIKANKLVFASSFTQTVDLLDVEYGAAQISQAVTLTRTVGGSANSLQAGLDSIAELIANFGSSETIYDLNVSFNQAPELSTTLLYATFDFYAADATQYQCSLDQSAYGACDSGIFLPSINEGEHSFSVRAQASDGQLGIETDYFWRVDNVFVTGNADLIATQVQPDPVANNSWRGIFRINCDFSHSSYNDPIVYPGVDSAAHLHRFYGNTLVDHNTTLKSLYTQGESSCQGNLLNLSSYWLPALLAPVFDSTTGLQRIDSAGQSQWQAVPAVVGDDDDEAHEIFYYSAGVDQLESIQPIPAGLRMIAGDHGTQPGQQQDSSIVRWHCQSWQADDASNPQFSSSIPTCYEPDRLRLDIFFPSCWNGVDLDSADHKSHVAYPIDTGSTAGMHCPESHPVAIVRPSYHYAFGVKPGFSDPASQSTKGWRLASDMYELSDGVAGGLSLHADWFNAWHPGVMAALLEHCIKQGLDCHDGNLANGYRLSGTRAGSQIEPEVVNAGLGN